MVYDHPITHNRLLFYNNSILYEDLSDVCQDHIIIITKDINPHYLSGLNSDDRRSSNYCSKYAGKRKLMVVDHRINILPFISRKF
jgi:hypothetical protein